MAPRPNLEALLRATAKRDRVAFGELYAAEAPKLYAIILRICRDQTLANDVMQEVFLAIWRKAGRYYAGEGSVRGWLSAIARNRAIDAVRKRAHAEGPTEAAETERMTGTVDLERSRAAHADLDVLVKALDQLDGPQRSALLLAYFEGRSRDELALRFDLPVKAMKTLLRDGLAKLGSGLQE